MRGSWRGLVGPLNGHHLVARKRRQVQHQRQRECGAPIAHEGLGNGRGVAVRSGIGIGIIDGGGGGGGGGVCRGGVVEKLPQHLDLPLAAVRHQRHAAVNHRQRIVRGVGAVDDRARRGEEGVRVERAVVAQQRVGHGHVEVEGGCALVLPAVRNSRDRPDEGVAVAVHVKCGVLGEEHAQVQRGPMAEQARLHRRQRHALLIVGRKHREHVLAADWHKVTEPHHLLQFRRKRVGLALQSILCHASCIARLDHRHVAGRRCTVGRTSGGCLAAPHEMLQKKLCRRRKHKHIQESLP